MERLEQGVVTLNHLLLVNDPGFGGLICVLNNRNEFLWVREKFAGE